MRLLRRSSWFSCVAVALALGACGDVKSNPDGSVEDDAPDGDFTLTVDPGTLTIPIASSATVTVTIARTGTVGDVTLSATGLGANLTAEFSPNPIPAGSTTSTATIRVNGGTAPATSTVTITGDGAGKSHSGTVMVTTQTITVTGTVRGNRPGVRVGIIGKQSQLSGAGGVFTFTDVTPPYDLYTFGDNGCSNLGGPSPTVYFFDDLTRPDPIVTAGTVATCPLVSLGCLIGPCPNANFSGTRTGAGNNTDEVLWEWTSGSVSATLGNGTVSGNIGWNSGTTNSGFLHALQLTRKPNGAPNAFLGYVRTGQLTLTNGTAQVINLNFSTVNSTATLTGTITQPTGYPVPDVAMYQEFGTDTRALWDTQTNTIDANFPLIATAGGTSFYASTTLGSGNSYFVQPLTGTATINFTMPAAPELTAPAAAATGVTTTTPFTFTAPSDVISEVYVNSTTTQGTARAVFRIFTKNTQVTLPVIPELPLPGSQSFSWTVRGYGPNASVNDAAGMNELESVISTDTAGPPHAYTTTASRAFTTL